MKSADYYRKQAAEVRRRADEATRDDFRARYLDIVAQYEALAEEADEAFKDALKKIATEPKKADR
jgi:hypothetical protein